MPRFIEFLAEGWNPERLRGMPTGGSDFHWLTDIEVRKHGDQIGLETLVVHAANVECYQVVGAAGTANASNTPPRDYNRKVET